MCVCARACAYFDRRCVHFCAFFARVFCLHVVSAGLAWSEQINTRLLLQRFAAAHEGGDVRRSISVVHAPHLPVASCPFHVTEDGFFGIGLD